MTNTVQQLETYLDKGLDNLTGKELESFTQEVRKNLRGQNLTNTNSSVGLLQIIAAEKVARSGRKIARLAISISTLAFLVSCGILVVGILK